VNSKVGSNKITANDVELRNVSVENSDFSLRRKLYADNLVESDTDVAIVTTETAVFVLDEVVSPGG